MPQGSFISSLVGRSFFRARFISFFKDSSDAINVRSLLACPVAPTAAINLSPVG